MNPTLRLEMALRAVAGFRQTENIHHFVAVAPQIASPFLQCQIETFLALLRLQIEATGILLSLLQMANTSLAQIMVAAVAVAAPSKPSLLLPIQFPISSQELEVLCSFFPTLVVV